MRSALPLWLAALCCLPACNKNDTEAPVSPGDVFLEITALHPRASDVWLPPRAPDPAVAGDEGHTGDAEPVVIGCDRRVGVDIHVEYWYLRAPDACGGQLQCGYAALDVDPGTESSTSTYAAAPSFYLDLCPLDLAGKLVGYHTLTPRLVEYNGKPFTHPYASTPQALTVTFASDDCSTDGTGGPSAYCLAAETAGAGGAPASNTGAGGAP